MKNISHLFFVVACIVGCYSTLVAQPLRLVYRERNATTHQQPDIFSHGTSRMIFVGINRVGVFRLIGPDFRLEPVAGTQGAAGYEYHSASTCSGGDVFVHQRGFLGSRFFRIDSVGTAHPILVEGGSLSAVGIQTDGTGFFTLTKPDSSTSNIVTVDCGRTWFSTSGSYPADINILGSGGRVLLTEHKNPLRFSVVRPGLGNREYALPLKTKAVGSIGFYGADSIVWTSSGRTNSVADTIWYCNITDSLRKRFDTVLSVIGLSDSLDPSTVQLVNTPSGKLYMFGTTRISQNELKGWYARYANGLWTLVDSCPREINFANRLWDSHVPTLEYRKPYPVLVTLHLDRENNQIVRQKPEPALVSGKGIVSPNGLTFVSPGITRLSFDFTTDPSVFFSDEHGMRTLNDVLGQIEQLDLPPSLLGFVGTDGYPVIVGVHDMAISKVGSQPGLVRAFSVRGERGYNTKYHGPRSQSTRGLFTPYMGGDEVIFPGATVGLYEPSGRFISTLYDGPATAVERTATKKLLIADGPLVRAAISDVDTAVFDLSSIGCTVGDTAGFVSSMETLSDGSVLAFVNGLEIQDAETLERRRYRCGFIARSTDEGRTWTRCEQPMSTPYFLGHIVLSDGAIVASATTLVRDTRPQESDDIFPAVESKNHTLNDRSVLRSTDMGRTWSVAHSSLSSASYRYIGGEGVVAEDGSLKLVTTDGLLRSTDKGLTWDLHNEDGIDGGTQIISMFQQAPRSRVYFCTTTGVYALALPSSVSEDVPSVYATSAIHQAKTWTEHVSYWSAKSQTVAGVYSLIGQRMDASVPSPGPYMVVLDNNGKQENKLVLVLAE